MCVNTEDDKKLYEEKMEEILNKEISYTEDEDYMRIQRILSVPILNEDEDKWCNIM